LFALEDALAGALSEHVKRQLSGRPALRRRGTTDAEAHRLYLAARYNLLRSFRGREAMMKALGLATQAIERDSKYAEPNIIAAGAYNQLAIMGDGDPRDLMLKAKTAALRAVELAPELAEAHGALALTQLYSYELPESKRSHERALELDPANELALIAHSDYYLFAGNFDESLRTRKRLQELIPMEPLWVADVAHPLLYSGRHEEALQWTRRALEMDPRFPLANTDLILILRSAGRFEESVAASLKWRESLGADPAVIAGLRQAFAQGGIRAYDAKRLEQAAHRTSARAPSPSAMASLYVEVGDKEKALDFLEASYEARVPSLVNLKSFPAWRPLREHARYRALLKKLGWE
jgi:serine/threonine-protein kinase